MLFKMCTTIDSWLLADTDNVVVVHCMVQSPLPLPSSLPYHQHANGC